MNDLDLDKASSPPGTAGENDAPEVNNRTPIRLWLRLLACTSMIEAELRRQFRTEFDFTIPRFDVLAQLDREPGGLVLGELPKRLMISAGSLTPIIDRLVSDGFITRTPSNLDRRVQIVCLTIEGRKSFRRMARKHGTWLSSLLEGLSQDQLDEMIKQLDTLKGVVKNATANSGSRPG